MASPRTDRRTKGGNIWGNQNVSFAVADKTTPRVLETKTARNHQFPGAIGSTVPEFGALHPDTVNFPNAYLRITESEPGDNTDQNFTFTYDTLPGTTLTEYNQDPTFLIPGYRTTQPVLASTAAEPSMVAGQMTTFKPDDLVQDTKIVEGMDLGAVNAFYRTEPNSVDLSLPRVLLALVANWNISQGTGVYQEQGSGGAVGEAASLALTAEGTSQGSVSLDPTIIPYYGPQPGLVPVLDYFFFLPDPVTLSAVLTRSTAIATILAGTATAVNEWPTFQTVPLTFTCNGQKISVSARATVRCAVSLVATDTSEALSRGAGTSQDGGSTVHDVTITDCIFGSLTVMGSTIAFGIAQASAFAALDGGNNFPGGADSAQAFGIAVGAIGPVSVGPTPVPSYPTSGLYMQKPEVQPYRLGYSMIRARIFDFGVLGGTFSIGQPQITVVDFFGLTGAHFAQAKAQITTVDFTGKTGASFQTGLPQVTQLAFAGFPGPHFVTGGDGLYWLLYDAGGDVIAVWYDTGTETEPTVAGATAYLKVNISPTGTANNVVSNTQTAINTAYFPATFHAAIPIITTPTITVSTIYSGPTTNAADGNTGVAISTIQAGVGPGVGFATILPSSGGAVAGIWFNASGETQPYLGAYGVSRYVEVMLTPTLTAAQCATALATAMAAQTAIWTNSVATNVVTFTSVSKVSQTDAFDVNSGLTIATTQQGGNTGLFLDIYGYQGPTVPSAIWFNTGSEIAPVVNGFALGINISPTGTAASMAAAVVAQIPQLTGGNWQMTQVNDGGTLTAARFVASQNQVTTNAADVNSGASVATTQSGVAPSA